MRTLFKALLVSSLLGASAASAADATFTLNLPVMSFTTTESKVKPDGGTETKETTTAVSTADLTQSYASVQFGSILVYVFPLVDAKKVAVSFAVSEMIEVGLDLGINSLTTKEAKGKNSSTMVGAFAWVYPKLGAINAEAGLIIDSTTVSGKETTVVGTGAAAVAGEVKTNKSKMDIMVIANALVPLAKNLNYAGGFWYLMSTTTTKDPANEKGKSSNGQFGVNIASLRLTLN